RFIAKARSAAALALMCVWLAVAVPGTLERWGAQPSTADRLLDELTYEAVSACPTDQRVLLLSDDTVGWMRGSYLVYPLRLDVVQRVDGFTASDLDTHAGGCLLTYGPQTHSLDALSSRLSTLRPGESGALYRIAP